MALGTHRCTEQRLLGHASAAVRLRLIIAPRLRLHMPVHHLHRAAGTGGRQKRVCSQEGKPSSAASPDTCAHLQEHAPSWQLRVQELAVRLVLDALQCCSRARPCHSTPARLASRGHSGNEVWEALQTLLYTNSGRVHAPVVKPMSRRYCWTARSASSSGLLMGSGGTDVCMV
jgi:hypothetical protein